MSSSSSPDPEAPDAAPIRAPELGGALAWLNVDRPLSLQALRGKVVLLDFWTYGCINCIHLLPDLARLEAKYANELVVIGVHSPKFDNEKQTDNLRQILLRYGITHPVANDADFKIWRAYTVRGWPTQVLIDPNGYIVGAASGEGHAEQFDRAIAAVIAVFDERGELDRRPFPVVLEHLPVDDRPSRFPGKVLADAAFDRLFVADSNHHRVLVCTMDGRIVDTLGSGAAGEDNGAFGDASFRQPQGMAVSGDTLFIADTGNHLIRAADLATREVRTVAGTGHQARWAGSGGAALETSLNSPWDLSLHGRLLFIAMAGPHQIWMVDLMRGLAWPYAGSGREARVDGTVDDAAFAQPSGLASEGTTLYVADSESNIIRAIDLPPVNQVRTLAGGDLFDFGDVDGVGDAVRLQHPLGVAAYDGRVYIADTYNHRIKVLDPSARRVRVFAGSGRVGHRDGPATGAMFYEPGGLSAAAGRLYVADTNNHAIRVIDLVTGVVSTLDVRPA